MNTRCYRFTCHRLGKLHRSDFPHRVLHHCLGRTCTLIGVLALFLDPRLVIGFYHLSTAIDDAAPFHNLGGGVDHKVHLISAHNPISHTIDVGKHFFAFLEKHDGQPIQLSQIFRVMPVGTAIQMIPFKEDDAYHDNLLGRVLYGRSRSSILLIVLRYL